LWDYLYMPTGWKCFVLVLKTEICFNTLHFLQLLCSDSSESDLIDPGLYLCSKDWNVCWEVAAVHWWLCSDISISDLTDLFQAGNAVNLERNQRWSSHAIGFDLQSCESTQQLGKSNWHNYGEHTVWYLVLTLFKVIWAASYHARNQRWTSLVIGSDSQSCELIQRLGNPVKLAQFGGTNIIEPLFWQCSRFEHSPSLQEIRCDVPLQLALTCNPVNQVNVCLCIQ
jgi:hypothetical protein